MSIIDLLIVILYMAGLIIVGLYFQKKASANIESYFLGNRNLPWWALGASGMASNLDVAGTMIIIAFIYALGAKGFYIEIRGGVTLIMAFLMIFMGKWNRRAGVMTLAEWMVFRFGNGKQGKIARLIMAMASIIVSIAMITYFAKGAGKFVGEFLNISPELASIIMICIAMVYTVTSGLFGVVFTDVFQGILISFTIVYVSLFALLRFDIPEVFNVSVPLINGGFQTIKTTFAQWSSIVPKWKLSMPGEYAKYNLFGIAIMFYVFKVTIEGMGGTGGYMIQRYFAAKDDRDAGRLSLLWTFLLSFRWPFIAAIAVAAMSTFDSTVNAGAAYWVKDIYQAFIKKKAGEKELILQGRLASIVIVIFGLLFSFAIRNINEIWGWITMSIGAGLIIPQLIRWYWWRLNGYGFAIGTFTGMIVAIIQKVVAPEIPEYSSFIVASLSSLVATIVGTLLTPPTDEKVLTNFYRKTRPFGLWKPIRGKLAPEFLNKVKTENRRDIISLFFAVPWQICLFMMWITLIMKRFDYFKTLLLIVLILSIALYFSWYRHLKVEKQSNTMT